jgi:hypothetical protein
MRGAFPALLSVALSRKMLPDHALAQMHQTLIDTVVAARATRRTSNGALCLEVYNLLAPDATAAANVSKSFADAQLTPISELTLRGCLCSTAAAAALLRRAAARLGALDTLAIVQHEAVQPSVLSQLRNCDRPCVLPGAVALAACAPALARSLRRLSLKRVELQLRDVRLLGPA